MSKKNLEAEVIKSMMKPKSKKIIESDYPLSDCCEHPCEEIDAVFGTFIECSKCHCACGVTTRKERIERLNEKE